MFLKKNPYNCSWDPFLVGLGGQVTRGPELLLHVWFQKISIPPPTDGYFTLNPHPSGNSSLASYLPLKILAFETPPCPPPQNFQ